MIGGSGEKVTLRLVAQYAQFCNVGGDPETVGRLLEALKGHCDRLGRDYGAITKSAYTMVMIGKDEADVEQKREKLSRYIPRRGASIGTPGSADRGVQAVREGRRRVPDLPDAGLDGPGGDHSCSRRR